MYTIKEQYVPDSDSTPLADKSCIWRRANGRRTWPGEMHPQQKTARLERPVRLLLPGTPHLIEDLGAIACWRNACATNVD